MDCVTSPADKGFAMYQDNLPNRALKALIDEVNRSEISSIHTTLVQILNIMQDPQSSAKQLKDIIERDPPLSVKVLRLANSAYYGAAHSIDEIQQAIVWLGFDLVKELALSQKVCELFEQNVEIDDYSRAALWKHSVAVALCGKLIYRREFRLRGENIYAAGRLHDIGIIIEDQFRHAQLETILRAKKTYEGNMPPAEKAVLGFSHAEIAAGLCNLWHFPQELAVSIGDHHQLMLVEPEHRRICQTLFLSDQLCQQNGIGFGDEPAGDLQKLETCLSELGIKGVAVSLLMSEVTEEITRMEEQGWF